MTTKWVNSCHYCIGSYHTQVSKKDIEYLSILSTSVPNYIVRMFDIMTICVKTLVEALGVVWRKSSMK